MYKGVKVPELQSSVFNNYEVGGWAGLVQDVLSVDISVYELQGINEIVSVKLDDGSTENRNAGKTLHQGIELGMNASFAKSIVFASAPHTANTGLSSLLKKGFRIMEMK